MAARTLPYAWYDDPAVLRVEQERIFARSWQYATRADVVAEPGSMLAIQVDDVVDELEEASDLLGLYGIELPTKHAVQQTALLVSACEQLLIACDNLKGFGGVQDALVELKRLEDEGDRVLRDGLAALFRDDGIDPLMVIRWKDVYDRLEEALDSCETAANTIANIVVKNA